jgi:hypothetical protein
MDDIFSAVLVFICTAWVQTFSYSEYHVQCHWEQQAQQPSRHTYLDYGAEHINNI